MNFRQGVSIATVALSAITLARTLVSFATLGPWDAPGAFLVWTLVVVSITSIASFLAGLLLARGFWLLPSPSGRGFVASGFLVIGLLQLVFGTFFGVDAPLSFGVLAIVLIAFYGLATVFGAAWWDGHEPSRYALMACFFTLALFSLARLESGPDAVRLVFSLASIAVSTCQGVALLPRFDAKPGPSGMWAGPAPE